MGMTSLFVLTDSASAYAMVDGHNDESDVERLSRHVRTLLDVAVHTENNPKFLDWAESYCDSLDALPNGEYASSDFRERIAQTRAGLKDGRKDLFDGIAAAHARVPEPPANGFGQVDELP